MLERAGEGRRQSGSRRAVGLTFLSVVLVGMTAHLYRAAPAVVAPDILAELDLGTAWAAYITSGFFVAAALTQIPAGMLFDTFGLRRTIPTMLLLAAAGALLFCTARSGPGLLAGRLLMGVGCGSVIMGGVVLCAKWFGPARFSSVVGLILAISQLGNLASTAPTAMIAAAIGWRGAFLALAAMSLVVAVVYYLIVRDSPPDMIAAPARRQSLSQIVGGSWAILANRDLWPVFAMAFVAYASSFSIAGVWGGVYLSDIHDLGLVARGNMLLLMVGAFALGLFFFGWLGQKIGSLKRAVSIGTSFSAAIFILAALIPNPSLAVTGAIFVGLGAANGACGTIIPHGRKFYSDDSVGRGVTVLNTLVLSGALTFQVLTGLLMDGLNALGVEAEPAFRILFAAHALALAAGILVYSRAAEGAQSSAPPAAVQAPPR